MIETDMLFAYVKKEDWLKPAANKLLPKIIKGELSLPINRNVNTLIKS